MHIALKEWDLVISALLAGRQAILLRKGGILEAENQFELEHRRFLLFPTFVHQDPRMVKPQWRGDIRAMAAEPAKVEIRGYTEAARIWEVPGRRAMEMLSDLHVWDAPLLDMRFAYRPEKPLYLVAVRAFALASPVVIANTLEYAGCRSWVPLAEDVDVDGARPAMADGGFAAVLERIDTAFGTRGQ
jgi:hypothetical protein